MQKLWSINSIKYVNKSFFSWYIRELLAPTITNQEKWTHVSLSGKESTWQWRRCKGYGFDPWMGKIPCNRKWQPIPVFLPGKFHGQRKLAGYSPWGHKEWDMTEGLSIVSLRSQKKRGEEAHGALFHSLSLERSLKTSFQSTFFFWAAIPQREPGSWHLVSRSKREVEPMETPLSLVHGWH